MYIEVLQGGTYYDTPLWLGYFSLAILELLWSTFIYSDWRKMVATEN
jgi:hypothetical protein